MYYPQLFTVLVVLNRSDSGEINRLYIAGGEKQGNSDDNLYSICRFQFIERKNGML